MPHDDETQDRRVVDSEYRAHMQEHVDSLSSELALLKQDVAAVKGDVAAVKVDIQHNTELTTKVSQQVEITQPFFSALNRMNIGDQEAAIIVVQSFIEGVRTIGRVGGGLRIAFRWAVYLAAGWFFVKALILGQGVDAAMAAFWRFISKDIF